MKLADGLFLKTCKKMSEKYQGIKFESMIVDNASMQVRFLDRQQPMHVACITAAAV